MNTFFAVMESVRTKREELEADMLAISEDARTDGRLVVTLFPEKLSLCWLHLDHESCEVCMPRGAGPRAKSRGVARKKSRHHSGGAR